MLCKAYLVYMCDIDNILHNFAAILSNLATGSNPHLRSVAMYHAPSHLTLFLSAKLGSR